MWSAGLNIGKYKSQNMGQLWKTLTVFYIMQSQIWWRLDAFFPSSWCVCVCAWMWFVFMHVCTCPCVCLCISMSTPWHSCGDQRTTCDVKPHLLPQEKVSCCQTLQSLLPQEWWCYTCMLLWAAFTWIWGIWVQVLMLAGKGLCRKAISSAKT